MDDVVPSSNRGGTNQATRRLAADSPPIGRLREAFHAQHDRAPRRGWCELASGGADVVIDTTRIARRQETAKPGQRPSSGHGQAGTPFSMGTLMSEPYSVQDPS